MQNTNMALLEQRTATFPPRAGYIYGTRVHVAHLLMPVSVYFLTGYSQSKCHLHTKPGVLYVCFSMFKGTYPNNTYLSEKFLTQPHTPDLYIAKNLTNLQNLTCLCSVDSMTGLSTNLC